MPVCMIQRSGIATGPLSKAPLALRTTISRSRHDHAAQVRTLWWWGGRKGHYCSSSLDESMEERLRRHQKIMRYRYSKALRRRAVWESDENPRLSWPWRMPGRWLGRRCGYHRTWSSESPPGPKQQSGQDEEWRRREEEHPYESFHKDFESFKAAVDRAIERDPYGTLFGRRLQSPPSANNSSWTSFSWIFDQRHVGEGKMAEDQRAATSGPKKDSTAAPQPSEAPPISPSSAPTEASHSKPDMMSSMDQDYVYDPISMRKVPKVESSSPPTPARKAPMESLFSEQEVDIPIKMYKPSQANGEGGPRRDDPKPAETSELETAERSFGSSCKPELHTFLPASAGANIDTTAEFAGKYQAGDGSEASLLHKKARDLPEPDENAPLFSGTTYQSKSDAIINEHVPRSDWLVREGFKTHHESSKETDVKIGGGPIGTVPDKMELALDRMSKTPSASGNQGTTKLETSLDRLSTKNKFASRRQVQDPEQLPETESGTGSPAPDTTEDIDLLRASDVRAATRSARVTKQDAEKSKQEIRAKLEADYTSRQKGENEKLDVYPDNYSATKEKLSKSLANVWNHIRDYPTGVVAKTVQSMGVFNDNYKKYTRRDKPLTDSTEKIVFKDETLSKTPSIYKKPSKPSTVEPVVPSKEVLDAERENESRRATLKHASEEAKKNEDVKTSQVSQLAAEIRSAYESEYGAIDVNHRQRPSKAPEQDSEQGHKGEVAMEIPVKTYQSPHNPKPHPLQTATVKPGIITDPVIEHHVTKFEPKFAEIVDGAKQVKKEIQEADARLEEIKSISSAFSKLGTVVDGLKEVRRELHDARLTIKALESQRPQTYWNAPNASASVVEQNITPAASELPADDSAPPEPGDSTQKTQPPNEQALSASSRTEPSKHVEPNNIPEPVITPSSSTAGKDHQQSPEERLRRQSFTSAYVILVYNPVTGQVEANPMNEPTADKSETVNALKLLASLNHAAEFLKHFPELETSHYELVGGNGDMLIFKKKAVTRAASVGNPRQEEERHSISAEEVVAAGQPIDQLVTSTPEAEHEAATVLDKFPTEIQTPGPAAPTAPPSSLPLTPKTKVRRQENVFSGTIRPTATSSSSKSDGERAPAMQDEKGTASQTNKEGAWTRFKRGVRHVLLTATAFVGIAYGIGFVAEGVGAQNQQRKGLENAAQAEQGPRKRIVMTGQRPGIFSTESSR